MDPSYAVKCRNGYQTEVSYNFGLALDDENSSPLGEEELKAFYTTLWLTI